jgi:hypothetical protein
MDILQLKLSLIERIVALDDAHILQQLHFLVEKTGDRFLPPLSKEELYENVDEAVADYENGRVFSSSEADHLIASWK